MRTPLWLLVAATVSACGGKGAPKEAETIGVSKRPDHCTILPKGCPGGADEDGCPDVVFDIGEGCALTAQSVANLKVAASELDNEIRLTRLLVVAPTVACANVVRAHFEANGITGWRVDVAEDPNRSFVSLEVEAWQGIECRSGRPVKPPPDQQH